MHGAKAAEVRHVHGWLQYLVRLNRGRFDIKNLLAYMDAGPSSMAVLYVKSLRQVTTQQQLDIFVASSLCVGALKAKHTNAF